MRDSLLAQAERVLRLRQLRVQLERQRPFIPRLIESDKVVTQDLDRQPSREQRPVQVADTVVVVEVDVTEASSGTMRHFRRVFLAEQAVADAQQQTDGVEAGGLHPGE